MWWCGDWKLLLEVIFVCWASKSAKFIKNQESKLNNHQTSEKRMAGINFTTLLWLQIPLRSALITAWTRTIWVSQKDIWHRLSWGLNQLFFILNFLHSPSTATRLAIGCRNGDGAGSYTQPGQWEELDRKHLWADQVPGVSAQGNQRHICESFIALLLILSKCEQQCFSQVAV